MSMIEAEMALASIDDASSEIQKHSPVPYDDQLQAIRLDPDFQARQVFESIDSGEITLPDEVYEHLKKVRCERVLEAIRLQTLLENPLSAGPLMSQLDEAQANLKTYSGQIVSISRNETQETATDGAEKAPRERRSLLLGAIALKNKVVRTYRRASDVVFVEGEYGENALIPN